MSGAEAKHTAADVPRLLDEYVEQAEAYGGQFHYDFDPKSLPTGAALLKLPKPAAAAAATEALARWRAAVAAAAEADPPESPSFGTVGRDAAAGGAGALLDALLRRALPLDAATLHVLAEEAAQTPVYRGEDGPGRRWDRVLSFYGNPFLGLAKQAEAFLKTHGDNALVDDLRDALRAAAARARAAHNSYSPTKKYADRLEAFAGPSAPAAGGDGGSEEVPADLPPAPEPTGEPVTLAPDGFTLAADDPLRPVHELFTAYLADFDRYRGVDPAAPPTRGEADGTDYHHLSNWSPSESSAGAALVGGTPEENARVLIAGLTRVRHVADWEARATGRPGEVWDRERRSARLREPLTGGFYGNKRGATHGGVRCDRQTWVRLLETAADARADPWLLAPALGAVGPEAAAELLENPSRRLREACRRIAVLLRHHEYHRGDGGVLALVERTGEPHGPPVLDHGEAWTDAALAALDRSKKRDAWTDWLRFCGTASAAKPAAKWSKAAGERLKTVGKKRAREALLDWFPLADKPRTDVVPPSLADGNRKILPHHADVLKGLVWCSVQLAAGGKQGDDAELARALAGLAVSAYKKVPGVGPRLVKVGNACVWALGALPGRAAVGRLAALAVKVKFGTAQKQIEKALAGRRRTGGPAPRRDRGTRRPRPTACPSPTTGAWGSGRKPSATLPPALRSPGPARRSCRLLMQRERNASPSPPPSNATSRTN